MNIADDIASDLKSRFNNAAVFILDRWEVRGLGKSTPAEDATVDGFGQLMNTTAEIPVLVIERAKKLAASAPDKYEAAIGKSIQDLTTGAQTMPASATAFLEKIILAVHFSD